MDEKAQIVVDFIKSKEKNKSKFYFKDLAALFPDEKPRAAKKIINKMIDDEILEYWSSGSTTMYGLKGAGKQHDSEGEE
ncbi:MAG: dissimilatory sulfite reductase D family protein [Desulfoplanes sp.]|nr:dissimilatory sulfite reductase D family protein [Desulfoplanes sp.]MDD4648698.1 dissimilatory sulfite reductase D family protein [Desulfoplanes sp.]